MKTRSLLYLAILITIILSSIIATSQPTRGAVAFQLTWGGANNDVAQGVAVDSSGNFYVTGYTHSFGLGSTRVFVLKINSTGGLVWQNTWGGANGEYGKSVAVDSQGNIYVTGYTGSFGAGGNDIFVLKWNSTGSLLWQQTWGGTGDDLGFGIAVDASNNAYVTGYTTSLGLGAPQAVLLKYNSAGSLLWQRAWNNSMTATYGQGVAVDSAGSIFVGGINFNSTTESQNALILKFNPSGSLVWQRTWGSLGNTAGYSIAVDSSNSVYLAGSTQSLGAGADDAFILKLSSSGDPLWLRTWGGTSTDQARGISIDNLGYLYVSGFTSSFGNTPNHVFLLSLNSTGGLLWQTLWGGSVANSNDQAFGVAASGGGYAATAGLVTENAPYSTSAVSASFKIGNLTLLPLTTPTNPATSPILASAIPIGSVVGVSGSLSYAGGQDAFLLKYGAPTHPSPPTNLVATSHQGFVNLTWNPPLFNGFNSITGYRIYRGTSSGGESFLTSIGNKTSYIDPAIIGGTTYYYQVTALNSVGEGPLSTESSTTPTSRPTPPLNLKAVAAVGHVTLTWSPPTTDGGSSITTYNLYRGIVSGGESLLVSPGTATSYTDSGVNGGTTYYYKVTALNAIGESDPSGEVSGIPTSAPAPPQALQGFPSSGKIVLAWSAPSSNGGSTLTGYNVYRGTSSGSEVLVVSLPNQLAYSDTGLDASITYFYKVTAVNSIGESTFSNEVSATPTSSPNAPSPPQNLMATAGKNNVTITWSPPATNGGDPIKGYLIYRGTASNMETLYRSPGNVTAFVDTTVTIGPTYYYRVSAFNGFGEGALSNEANAKAFTTPSQPQSLQAVGGFQKIYLVWAPPSSSGGRQITGYNIYRGTATGQETLLKTIGNQTSFIDTSINFGIPYFYKVTSLNIAGEGPASSEATASGSASQIPPSPPQNLIASGGTATVTLTWSPPISNGGSSIMNYTIWRGTVSGGEIFLAKVGNVTTFTDSGRQGGTTYYYEVNALNANGNSGFSNEASASPISPPTSPNNPVATNGPSKVTLTWSAPSNTGGSSITNYKIYRGSTSGGETLFTTVGNVLSYPDASVTCETTYYYKISAVNGGVGEGPQSSEVSATPFCLPTAPQTPSATGGANQNTLSWSAPSDNGGSSITNYKLYRGTSSGGESLYQTLGNLLTYPDTGVTCGTTYYYKVSALNAAGEGPKSSEVSAAPYCAPSAPLNLAATSGLGNVTLSWTAPSSNGGSPITSYQIYRGTSSGTETLLPNVVTTTMFNDTGLTAGTTYYYYVKAVNSAGPGTASNEVTGTPLTPTLQTPPSSPQNLKATAGTNSVNLTWAPPASNGGATITGYQIYRGTSAGGETLYQSVTNVTTYLDQSVTSGIKYYYKITAINGVGSSTLSTEESATPTAPAPPSSFPIIPVAIAALIIVAVGAVGVIFWRRRVSQRLMMPP